MANFAPSCTFLHQGVALHPEHVYAVPDDVARGLAGIGFGTPTETDADISLPHLTWADVAMPKASTTLTPDPIVIAHGVDHLS